MPNTIHSGTIEALNAFHINVPVKKGQTAFQDFRGISYGNLQPARV